MLPKLRLTPLTWAINIAATASYKAVPSMLIVAPIGKQNLATRGSIEFFSSKQLMVMGKVAELQGKKEMLNWFLQYNFNNLFE